MPRTTLSQPVRSGTRKSYVREKEKKSAGAGNNHLTPHPPAPVGGGWGGGDYPGPERSKPTITDVLASANQLSENDRKHLLAQLALANQQPSTNEVRDVQMWSVAVYEGLVAAQGGSGAGVPGPAVVQRTMSSSAAWAPVSEFMKAAGFDRLSSAERQGMYRFLAELVIKHATYVSRKGGAPLGPKLVGSCSANIAALFDQNFPGYLRAGLAHLVARSLVARPH